MRSPIPCVAVLLVLASCAGTMSFGSRWTTQQPAATNTAPAEPYAPQVAHDQEVTSAAPTSTTPSAPAPADVDTPSLSVTRIAKLGLAIDIAAGDIEVLDTEFNGAPLEGNNVRVATSLEAMGSLRISVQPERLTAQEFVRMHRKLTPDLSHVATQKLADGWLVTFQYDNDRVYAVTSVRKIASRWIRCYAQPESAAASAIAKNACLSLRADASPSQRAQQPNRINRRALLGKWSLDGDEMSAVIEFKTGGRLTMKVRKHSMTRSAVGSGTYEWIDDSTLRFGFVLDRVPKVNTLEIVELTKQRLSGIDELGTTMTFERAR